MLSKSQIVARIQKLHREGYPLNISAVKRRWPALIASVYARKAYWGWKQALADAGIAYSDIKVELLDYTTCQICGDVYQNVGSHLNLIHEVTGEDYLKEFPGSELVCETLRLIRPGPLRDPRSLPHWEPIWTPEYVLDRLHAYRLLGTPLYVANIARVDSSLAAQIARQLGSWDRALEKIGVNPLETRRVRDRSALHRPEGILAEIQRRHAAGLPLNPFALTYAKDVSKRDQMLLKGGRRQFGSWPEAVRAAGLNPDDVISGTKVAVYRSKTAVKREIKRRHKEGLPLNHHNLVKGESGQRDGPLLHAGIRLYGNWDQALEAAGLSRQAVAPPPYQKNPKLHRELERIRKRLLEISKVSGSRRYEAMRKLHERDFKAVKRSRYGCWKQLALEMGIPLEKVSTFAFADQESVFEALAERQRRGLPNQPGVLFREERSLYSATCKHFGNFKHPELQAYLPQD